MRENNRSALIQVKNYILHPFSLKRSERILYLVMLNMILKFALLFVRIFPDDVDFYRFTGSLFLRGIIPYSDFIVPGSHIVDIELFFNTLHPNGPLNYIFYGFWMFAFGDSVFAIKVPWLISEILITILIYMIAEQLIDSDKAFLASMIYTLMPMSYFLGIFVGCDELITSAFTIAAVYFFIKQKNGLSSIFLALGTSYKLFPVFGLLPVFYYFISRKEIKQFINYLLYFVATYLIMAFPFIVLDFGAFTYWNFSQANRTITIPYFYHHRDEAFFSPIFTLFMIPVSPYTFYQIGLMSIIILPRLYKLVIKKETEYSLLDYLKDFSILILMLPLLSLSNNYRYFFWMLPFLIIYFMSRWNLGVPAKEFEPILVIQSIILIVFTTIILIISYTIESCLVLFSVHCYNTYIFTFLLVYLFYGLPTVFTLINKRFNKNYLIFTIASIIAGTSSLMLYEYWESIQYLPEQPIYEVISIITLLIATTIFLRLIFEDNPLTSKKDK